MIASTRPQQVIGGRARPHVVRALIAASIGSTIEFYDFTLYQVVAATYLGKLFFPGHDPLVATLAAFSTSLPGFVARPIGGIFFGHFGDRFGRKAMLIWTVVLMGTASFLIGLVPTYAEVGIWGSVMLVILRFLQGLGVSGEWGGAVLLGVEWQQQHNRRRRGWAAGWAQIGLPAGFGLSYLTLLAFTSVLGQDSYWAWRVPFLASIVLVVLGLYVRLGILETPIFTKVLETRRQVRWPMASILRSEVWRLALAILVAGSTLVGSIYTTFVLTYTTNVLKMGQSEVLTFVLIASAFSIGTVLFWSYLSDRIGRQRMYVLGALVALVFVNFYWRMLDSRAELIVLLAIVLSMAVRDIQYGPLASYIAETFPAATRYSGAATAYNVGSAAFSGLSSIIALTLYRHFHTSTAIAAYMMGGALLGVVAGSLLRDRSRDVLDAEYDGAEVAPAP